MIALNGKDWAEAEWPQWKGLQTGRFSLEIVAYRTFQRDAFTNE